jgi:hypothetical protein
VEGRCYDPATEVDHRPEPQAGARAARGCARRARVDFAICGGIAVTIHGAPRFTKDIDLLVPDAHLEAALDVARQCGFDLEAASMTFDRGLAAERHVHRVSKLDGPEALTLDMVPVQPGFAEVFASRLLVEWEGRVVPVVSIEGLVVMKRRAGRDQDLLDLKNLGVELDDEDPSNEER